MTIYDIEKATREKAPYFFSCSTMAFFRQTMKRFSVKKVEEGIYRIACPIRDHTGKVVGLTERYFYKDDLYSSVEEAHAAELQDK